MKEALYSPVGATSSAGIDREFNAACEAFARRGRLSEKVRRVVQEELGDNTELKKKLLLRFEKEGVIEQEIIPAPELTGKA